MFLLTTVLYPVVLLALCTGAALLVDRASGRFLPGALLPAVGAATLIAVSQLSTYFAAIAPATPFLMAAVALAGFALGSDRVVLLARRWRAWRWQVFAPVLVYGFSLAPVLLAGRPTFSSYLTLSDSAVHMLGADFILHHGQDYAHLDLRNSYGQYLNAYYNMGYPSGADTLFGGSAMLLGLPLIWAFQPFNAFILATAAGPAWLLLRRIGLDGAWAALAALTTTLPALIYAYELIGSIKEITSLPMVLTLGVLVVLHRRWLGRAPTGAIPFALVAAGGVSALGVGFAAWALAAALVLAVVLTSDLLGRRRSPAEALLLLGGGAVVTLVAALPTWLQASRSLEVATSIASTSNAGNLHTPLHTLQVAGVWLWGTYKEMPTGADRTATYLLIALTLLACPVGAAYLIRRRNYPLAGWFALVLLVWLAFSTLATTWVDAKVLMLTSAVLMLLAWGSLAALRASPLRLLGPALALVLAGGVLASDAIQYHSADVAPTARYQELARINTLFAGKGPTLFTDFDEYSLYELRSLDIGGPNFIYGPPAFAHTEAFYRHPVELERLPPADLLPYRLIVTRRDPSASRPPSAYRLLWQGSYYQVWGRRKGAPAAISDLPLSGPPAAQCTRIGQLSRLARLHRAQLIAAGSPVLVRVPVLHSSHPRGWGRLGDGLAMKTPGRLLTSFYLPHGGAWDLWLQGQIMPAVDIGLDGRHLAFIGAQLGGNSIVPNTLTPLRLTLSAGPHILSVTRGGSILAPGGGGTSVLLGIFLTPATAARQQPLHDVAAARWRTLCGHPYDWIEVVSASIGA